MMVSAPDILNASILIVDDQESNISLLEQLLREAGYTGVTSTMIVLSILSGSCFNTSFLVLRIDIEEMIWPILFNSL